MKTTRRTTRHGVMWAALVLLAGMVAAADPVTVVADDEEIAAMKAGTTVLMQSTHTTVTVSATAIDLPELIAAALTTAAGRLAQGAAVAAVPVGPQTNRVSASRTTTVTRGEVTLARRSENSRSGATEACELRLGGTAVWRTVNGVWQGGPVSVRRLRAAVAALHRAGFAVADLVVTVGDDTEAERARACLEHVGLRGEVRQQPDDGQVPAARASLQEAD